MIAYFSWKSRQNPVLAVSIIAATGIAGAAAATIAVGSDASVPKVILKGRILAAKIIFVFHITT
jgi:hypothetical protein